MTLHMTKEIASYMEAVFPEEGCGFLLKDGTWVPVENQPARRGFSKDQIQQHHLAEMSFLIPATEYLKHSRDIEGIVHSHTLAESELWTNNGPSVADQKHQRATGVPWLVCVLSEGSMKDHYVFDVNRPSEYFTDSAPYRPGIYDELTPVEEYYGPLYFYRDQSHVEQNSDWMKSLLEYLVLSGQFIAVAEFTEALPGDIFFFGRDKVSGPDTLVLFDGESYQSHPYHGQRTWNTSKPTGYMYQQLRKP